MEASIVDSQPSNTFDSEFGDGNSEIPPIPNSDFPILIFGVYTNLTVTYLNFITPHVTANIWVWQLTYPKLALAIPLYSIYIKSVNLSGNWLKGQKRTNTSCAALTFLSLFKYALMKRLLYTFLVLSIPYLLTAQDGINWVYGTDHYTEGSNILALPDGSWLVSGFSAGRPSTAQMIPIIGRYATSGWEEFDLDAILEYYGELGQLSEVLYDPSTGQYHFVLGQGVCDVGIPSELISFGALGNWQTSINYSAGREFALSTVPGDGFIWSPQWNPEMLWQRGADEVVALNYNWNEGDELMALGHWQSGTFLAQTQDALLLFSFNENGALLTDTYTPAAPNSSIQTFEVLNDEQVVVLENDTLRILNTDLESIVQIALEGVGTNHLAVDEDYIYLLQQLPSDGLNAFFLEHDLSETGRTVVDLGDYELGDMDAANGRIALVGAQNYTNTVGGAEPINSQLFVRTYTAAGPDIPDEHDVEVLGITLGDIIFEPYPFGPCGNGRILDLMVEVRNNSPFPIDDILLKFELDPPSICPSICDPYVTRLQHHTGLQLQPGAVISLPFDDFWISGMSDVDEFEVCINITAPNQPMEMDLANNSSCETVVVLDTDNAPVAEKQVSISPNPVSELLNLVLPAETKSIVVYDAAGQMVHQENVEDRVGWHELTVTPLPNGLYFVRTLTEQGIYTGRFIKQ